jgi:hypothetical protein
VRFCADPIRTLNFTALQLLPSHFSWDLGDTLEGNVEPPCTKIWGQNRGRKTTEQVHQGKPDDSNSAQYIGISVCPVPPRFRPVFFALEALKRFRITPSSSHEKIFTENYSETNFVVTLVVFGPRSSNLVNIHSFSLSIFPYLKLTYLSVEFPPPPKTIGQEMSECESILWF